MVGDKETSNPAEPADAADAAIEVLYIEITNRCNLNCIHCGNEDADIEDMDFEVIGDLLEEFNRKGGEKVILTGGEPLTHPRIKDILDLTEKHGYRTKLSTNALLLTRPEFSYVMDYDLGFRFSLDGPREVHNRIRRNPESYDRVIDAIREASKRGKQVVLRTTVMRENADSIVRMLEDLDHLTKDEQVKVFSNNIWPIRNIGMADSSQILSSEEYKEFLEDLNEGTRKLRPGFRIIVGPTFGYEENFENGPIQSNEIYKCDILNKSVHVAFNGDIYPCSFVHHPLGNIKVKEDSIYDVFHTEDAKRFRELFLNRENHDCDGCGYYEGCQAGCIAETYGALFGSEGARKVKDAYCFRDPETCDPKSRAGGRKL